MKRILAILCSFILLCSFAGCKGVMGGEDGASVSLTDSFSEGDSKGSSGRGCNFRERGFRIRGIKSGGKAAVCGAVPGADYRLRVADRGGKG